MQVIIAKLHVNAIGIVHSFLYTNIRIPTIWEVPPLEAGTSVSEKLETAGTRLISLACCWYIGICANLPDFPDGENYHGCFFKITFY